MNRTFLGPVLLLIGLLAAACDDDGLAVIPEPDAGFAPDAEPPVDLGVPDLGPPDLGVPDLGLPDAEPALEPVYIHTSSSLYTYDPDRNTTDLIGDFRTSAGPVADGMVDIAIGLDGRMYGGDRAGEGRNGTGINNVYVIDPSSAFCTRIFTIDDYPHGLTVLADGRLVVAGDRISVIDPATGQVEQELDSAYETSGDIVGLPDGFLYWTVRPQNNGEGDGLVRIDVHSGQFRFLGQVEVDRLFGLGYAEDALYGFSSSGRVVKIDPADGTVLEQRVLEGSWWGATTNPVRWDD